MVGSVKGSRFVVRGGITIAVLHNFVMSIIAFLQLFETSSGTKFSTSQTRVDFFFSLMICFLVPKSKQDKQTHQWEVASVTYSRS